MSEAEPIHEASPNLGETSLAAAGGLSEDTGSLLDALAEERDTLATEREVAIPVPGYGTKTGVSLYVKYRLLGGEELGRIGVRVQREFRKHQQYERVLYASIDTMIAACEGFYAEKEGEKIDLPFLNFGQELADALKFGDAVDLNSPARSVVIALFGGNMVALQQHTLLLGRWMGDTSIDVTSEFLEAGGNL
jgi:hypothetical protein